MATTANHCPRGPIFVALTHLAQAQEILEREAARLEQLRRESAGKTGNEGHRDAAALQRLYFEDDCAGGRGDGEAGGGTGKLAHDAAESAGRA